MFIILYHRFRNCSQTKCYLFYLLINFKAEKKHSNRSLILNFTLELTPNNFVLYYLKAELLHNSQPSLSIHGTNPVLLVNGVGELEDVSVTESGSGFQFKFTLYTEPASSFTYETTGAVFGVQERQLTNMTASQSKHISFILRIFKLSF